MAQPHVLLTVARSAVQDIYRCWSHHFWGHQRSLGRWEGKDTKEGEGQRIQEICYGGPLGSLWSSLGLWT